MSCSKLVKKTNIKRFGVHKYKTRENQRYQALRNCVASPMNFPGEWEYYL